MNYTNYMKNYNLFIALWPSGKATDSDSVIISSNLIRAAKFVINLKFFFFFIEIREKILYNLIENKGGVL